MCQGEWKCSRLIEVFQRQRPVEDMPPGPLEFPPRLIDRGRHSLMAAQVDEHLRAGWGVFHHLSPGADAAAVAAVVNAWWRSPRACKGCFHHKARDRNEEFSLRFALCECLAGKSGEKTTTVSVPRYSRFWRNFSCWNFSSTGKCRTSNQLSIPLTLHAA